MDNVVIVLSTGKLPFQHVMCNGVAGINFLVSNGGRS